MKRFFAGTTLLALTLLVAVGCRKNSAAKPARHIVRIEQMKFSPKMLTVRRGEVVEFDNTDLVPHTVTRPGPGGFDSGRIEAGKNWSYATEKAGEFSFACIFHPTMTGTIEVVESAEPSLVRTTTPLRPVPSSGVSSTSLVALP